MPYWVASLLDETGRSGRFGAYQVLGLRIFAYARAHARAHVRKHAQSKNLLSAATGRSAGSSRNTLAAETCNTLFERFCPTRNPSAGRFRVVELGFASSELGFC